MNGFDSGQALAWVPTWLTKEIGKNGSTNHKGRKPPSHEVYQELLDHIDPSDRTKWLGVNAASGAAYNRDPKIFEMNQAWSRKTKAHGARTDKYEREFFFEHSETRVGDEVTMGSVFHWAKEGGWKSKAGTVVNLDTTMKVMEEDPTFCDAYWDEMRSQIRMGDRERTEQDDLQLLRKFQAEMGYAKMSLDVVQKAVSMYAYANRRNPVHEWLNGLKWEEVERIETFFIDYFKAKDDAYTRAASKNFWIAMVARILKPGCKFDNVIVLEGKQGFRKSMALGVIGGEFFTEQSETVKNKDFFVNLLGKFLVEIGEMQSFTRGEIEKVKQIITAPSDRYRNPYARQATDHPRQCVFVGTTNRSDWNTDETGARRFWPIRCPGEIDVDGIRANREQFFAEAVRCFKKGEEWWIMPADKTLQEQADRYEPPVWAERIEWYINYDPVDAGEGKLRKNGELLTPLLTITVSEILKNVLLKEIGHWTKVDEMRVASALTYLKWTKRRIRTDSGRAWTWYSPDFKEEA